MKKRKASGVIAGKDQEQYHIGCKTGDLARDIILVGDPQRAFRISNNFDEVTIKRMHREYVTYTGKYKGFPISVMAIGIGQGNMEIAMIEIAQVVKNPRIIRCGTSSGLQKTIGLGDMVISQDVHDLGNLASYYRIDKKKVKSDAKLQRALVQACEALRLTYHIGKTASAPGFYGPQGRDIPGFPVKNKNTIQTLIKKKVSNLEMEVATMFSLASLKKIPVAAVCSAIGNRVRNDFMDDKGIIQAEKDSIQCTLKAFQILHETK